MRIARISLLSLAICVAVGACGTTNPSLPPAASPSEKPAMTTAPPASSASSTPGAGIASAGEVRFELPPRWKQVPMADFRAQLVAFGEPMTGPERVIVDRAIEAIDTGRTRIVAQGPTEGATGSIMLSIDEYVDSSLGDAAERLFKELSPFTEYSGVTRATIIHSLPIGPTLRLVETHEPPPSMPGGIPSRTVQYVTMVNGGLTVWILGTAPASDDTFEAVMTRVAETLAVS